MVVHYHLTNVEEQRQGPGPTCETERTGAPPPPPFCSGFQWKRLLIIKTEIPEKDLKIPQ